MSVEYFAALEAELPGVEAERALAAAESAVYPHLKSQDARSWWQAKTRVLTETAGAPGRPTRNHFTVNGVETNARGLRSWLRRLVGGGLGR